MKRLLGGLLLAVGILLMTASGLCSIAVVVTGMPMLINEPVLVLFPLVIGGLPFATGAALFWVGSGVLKEAKATATDAPPPRPSLTEGDE